MASKQIKFNQYLKFVRSSLDCAKNYLNNCKFLRPYAAVCDKIMKLIKLLKLLISNEKIVKLHRCLIRGNLRLVFLNIV